MPRWAKCGSRWQKGRVFDRSEGACSFQLLRHGWRFNPLKRCKVGFVGVGLFRSWALWELGFMEFDFVGVAPSPRLNPRTDCPQDSHRAEGDPPTGGGRRLVSQCSAKTAAKVGTTDEVTHCALRLAPCVLSASASVRQRMTWTLPMCRDASARKAMCMDG